MRGPVRYGCLLLLLRMRGSVPLWDSSLRGLVGTRIGAFAGFVMLLLFAAAAADAIIGTGIGAVAGFVRTSVRGSVLLREQ